MQNMVAVAVDTVHSNAQCTRLIQLLSAEVFLVVEVYTGGVLAFAHGWQSGISLQASRHHTFHHH